MRYLLCLMLLFVLACSNEKFEPGENEIIYSEYDECKGLTVAGCEAKEGCSPMHWHCDVVPEGYTFEEICPRGREGVDCVWFP